MNFTKYENYKDSGLEWLGEIPEDWEIKRLKDLFLMERGKFTHRPRNDPQMYDGKYPFLQTGSVSQTGKYITTYKQTLSEKGITVSKEFKKETILMTIAANIGDVSMLSFDAYFPDSIIGFKSRKINNNFAYYFLKILKQSLDSIKTTNTQDNINLERLDAIIGAIPKEKTQTKIGEYLDKKTSQIDKKIELLQAKKEKYQEFRRTIINRAVTKGIDKNVELKDSGVEWLGEIPKHWKIKRGKDIYDEQSLKGYGKEPLLAASQKLGVVLKTKLKQRSMEATKNFNDFKYVKKGDFVISLRSFEGGIEISHNKGIISPAYTVFSLLDELSNEYFKYLLKSDRFIGFLRSFITGIRDGQTIRFKEVGNIPFPTTSKTEQQQIANYLNDKTSKIDSIIVAIDKNIEVLNEFKKTLINDAVTGKIKVV